MVYAITAYINNTNMFISIRYHLALSATSGSYHKAGLPNIEGAMGSFYTNNYSDTGQALYTTSNYKQNMSYHDRDTADSFYNIVFNAGKSNSIYGNSNTVQPNSYTVRKIIKY